MPHWSEEYVGLPYENTVNDCAAFAARIANEVFHKGVVLPEHRGQTYVQRAKQVQRGAGELAVRTDTPEEGDAVLMYCCGRVSHIGIYCVINGEAYVLHAVKSAMMVVLHRIRDLQYRGLKVEGYYKWK